MILFVHKKKPLDTNIILKTNITHCKDKKIHGEKKRWTERKINKYEKSTKPFEYLQFSVKFGTL